ncbi:MAG: FHA domain-containing protein [Actinobacteria bacterium]|nr:FHA domain-containing protein [Actinomycetota bacterium]
MGTTTGDPTTITFHVDAETSGDTAVPRVDEAREDGCLIVTRGPNAGARFPLVGEFLTAGRHPESDIFLDDVTVSRKHVEVVRDGPGSYRVRDVGSLNGTYLNHERIEDAPLRNGDELQIGKFKLVYVDGGGSR